jgi:hypothetical protein
MSLELHLRAIIREEVTAALAALESAVKSAKGKTKAPAATAPESSQPAATPAAAPAQAPAVAPPAQSPAVPTPPLTAVNNATKALAGIDREAAVAVLTKYKATTQRDGKTIVNTSLLVPEQYQAVIDEMEEKKAAIDAAATQGSLV